MKEFNLREKKKELYEMFLRKKINFMEYINRRNDLDKEFIRLLKMTFRVKEANTKRAKTLHTLGNQRGDYELKVIKELTEMINKLAGDLK